MAGTVSRCFQRCSHLSQNSLLNAQFLPVSNQWLLHKTARTGFRVHPMQQLTSPSSYSTESAPQPEEGQIDKAALSEKIKEKKMSTAMRLYMQRKREHDIFIAREEAEFEMGKQHLANMMGMDKETMSQEDIDKSIEYLFPSGLLPEARPIMKPPAEIFHRQKDAEFNEEGRPFEPFFYTIKPNLAMALYKLRDSMESVTIFGDRLKKQGKRPDSEQVLDEGKLADTNWVTKKELENMFVETLTDQEYAEFITVLQRLLELPYSYRVRDEIFHYRVQDVALGTSQSQNFLEPQYDEEGRAYVEYEGRRKTGWAKVRVTKPGTGEFRVRNLEEPNLILDIGYFYTLKERLQIIYPLQFTKMLGLVDIDAEVKGSGPSAQAGAIRYATSMCLRSYVDKDMVTDMKINGLLTQDIRVKERKRYGRVKARKAYTWKRR